MKLDKVCVLVVRAKETRVFFFTCVCLLTVLPMHYTAHVHQMKLKVDQDETENKKRRKKVLFSLCLCVCVLWDAIGFDAR